ncbi:MAG: YggT family protein [Anaerolineae bacterium]|nr:YggT family protein [Anaerolineae bacterium]
MTQQNLRRTEDLNLYEEERAIAAANQNSAVARIVNIIYFLFGVLELLLATRVILHLIGANQSNGFVAFINALTAPFLVLFSTLVRNPALTATGVLEITTIIAMFAYAILAWLIGRMMWLLLSRPR